MAAEDQQGPLWLKMITGMVWGDNRQSVTLFTRLNFLLSCGL